MAKSDTAKGLREKIAASVKSAGKKLTKVERELLESLGTEKEDTGTGGVYASNMVKLADLLGVDRKTIQRKLKLKGNPGRLSNGKYHIEKWREFLAGSPVEPEDLEDAESGTARSPSSKQDWEIEKLKAVVRGLEFQQQVREGRYSLNDDVIRWEADTMMKVRTILLSIPNKMAAVIEMRPKEECEVLLKEGIDEALMLIHERKWKGSEVSEEGV